MDAQTWIFMILAHKTIHFHILKIFSIIHFQTLLHLVWPGPSFTVCWFLRWLIIIRITSFIPGSPFASFKPLKTRWSIFSSKIIYCEYMFYFSYFHRHICCMSFICLANFSCKMPDSKYFRLVGVVVSITGTPWWRITEPTWEF